MKRIIWILILTWAALESRAQTRQDLFYAKWENQDTSNMLSFLQSWIQEEPYNPDVYVGFFNYYAIQTFEEMVQVVKDHPQDGLDYTEIKDSLGMVEGYKLNTMIINDSILNIAFNWVDKGIQRYPDRLDLRMGKVYIAGETDELNIIENELIKALRAGDSIQHQWKWMKEEVLENPQTFLYGSIQGHLYNLFEREDSLGFLIIERVSQAILEQDPKNVMAIGNLATCRMIDGDYNEAIEILKSALKINDEDPILLSNLGFCYFEMKEWKKSRQWYTKAMKFSEANDKEYCDQRLKQIEEELNK
jgi:tetratricopeptide (TPR) repeat protein